MKWSNVIIGLLCGWFVGSTVCSERDMVNPRIIIVGAGAAGVAAVSKLYQSGLTNLTVLEASERYGGRIRTIPFGSGAGVVELGAQWCHGEQGNVVHELASRFPGLLKSSIAKKELALVRSNGERIDPTVFGQLMMLAEAIEELDERHEFDGSFGEYFEAKFWEKLDIDEAYRGVDRELARQFLVYCHNYNRGYSAYDSWYDVAAHEADGFEITEGDQLLAWTGSRGYSSILDILSGNYPGSDASTRVPLDALTILNKFVTNIQWQGAPGNSVVVTTEDGARYDAHHVIVTVSLGVLKENYRTMFTPPLPFANRQAVEGIQFGAVNKIFLLFDAPIPAQFGNAISLLWYERDLLALNQTNHAWTEAVSFFYRVDGQPNVLCAWLNGPLGRQAELLLDDKIREGLLHLLSVFVNKIEFGEVLAVVKSNWSSNRFFRGSYSSRSIATERMQTGAKYLAYPLMDTNSTPRVLMAGEATMEKYYSTVHGAVASGQREANRLIDLYKQKRGSNDQ